MELNDLLTQGAQLAVLGMSTVFIILTLLIVGIRCMAAMIPASAEPPTSRRTDPIQLSIPDDHRAAIEQAIARHRAR